MDSIAEEFKEARELVTPPGVTEINCHQAIVSALEAHARVVSRSLAAVQDSVDQLRDSLPVHWPGTDI